MKQCTNCNKNKEESQFWKRGGSRGEELYPYCKMCKREQNYKLRRETKKKIIDLLGGQCQTCGHKSETGVSLSIDHQNGEKHKDACNILQWEWSRIEEEIKKCDCWLLCMNCHMELEYKRKHGL